MSRLNIVRSGDTRQAWKVSERTASGVTFLVSWDQFQRILKGEPVEKVIPAPLKRGEYVIQYEVGFDGVHVYITNE